MQITVNVPDSLPLEKIEQLIKEIEQRLLNETTQTAVKKQRPIGLAKEQFKVPPTFFEPLPNNLMDAFEGH